MGVRQFNTDCEGPLSLNDNAYELAEYFIPDGGALFTLISKYDDILADIVKKPGYKAGDTLKLIVPFLKAYGATNQAIEEYCAGNIVVVPGAVSAMKYIREKMPSFIISTSYEQYLNAICDLVGFDRDSVYCTRLNMDSYEMEKEEIRRIRQIREEIDSLQKLHVPSHVILFDELTPLVKKTVEKLDHYFWEEINQMSSGEILREVNPMGGIEKANAVLHSLGITGGDLSDVMYVGDSITDVQALHLVRKNGGLAVSFNGNMYAIRESEIVCVSSDAWITSILADLFRKEGKDAVFEMVQNWSPDTIRRYAVEPMLIDRLLCSNGSFFFPRVEIVDEENKERMTRESEDFRKKIRGEEVGELG